MQTFRKRKKSNKKKRSLLTKKHKQGQKYTQNICTQEMCPEICICILTCTKSFPHKHTSCTKTYPHTKTQLYAHKPTVNTKTYKTNMII